MIATPLSAQEDGLHYQRMLEQIDEHWRDEGGMFAGRLADVDPKMQVGFLFTYFWGGV